MHEKPGADFLEIRHKYSLGLKGDLFGRQRPKFKVTGDGGNCRVIT